MPVVIAIAIYFCIADGVLISQCLYYNIINKRKDGKRATAEANAPLDEEEPLLARQRSGSLTIPGSRRRSSTASARRRSSGQQPQHDTLSKILEEDDRKGRLWIKNTVSILAICAAGAAGWALAWQSGAWRPTSKHQDNAEESMAIGAQILGYASAVAYLGARIPQIIKNWRDKSCEGEQATTALTGTANPYRSFLAVLHLVIVRQCHLRSWNSVSLDREGVFHNQFALADRKLRHNGGGCSDLRAVPHVFQHSFE